MFTFSRNFGKFVILKIPKARNRIGVSYIFSFKSKNYVLSIYVTSLLKIHYSITTWNYITNWSNMQENFFKKSIEFGMSLKSNVTCYKQNRNVFRYQTTDLVKIWFLFLVYTKRKWRGKSEFVTTFEVIIITITFISKCLSFCL